MLLMDRSYARAFDAISDERDAHYSARSFVRWVRLEAKDTGPLVATAGSNGDGRTSTRLS